MEYKYILPNGTSGPLDRVFVDNSTVILNMISSCSDSDEIPILNNSINSEDVKNVTLLLKYLLNSPEVSKEQIDSLISENNLEKIEKMILLSEYCDIELTLNYLLKFIAELVRKSSSLENLKKLFDKNYKDFS